jgi:hypothetical protein
MKGCCVVGLCYVWKRSVVTKGGELEIHEIRTTGT